MSDNAPSAAQTDASRQHLPFQFHGRAGEFFGIWIVNLLLTILTLGIYSAWAKVRTTRYFYGNVQVDGHGFEYHAKPIAILIGRIIALLALTLFSASQFVSPYLYGALLILLLIAIPWLINRSLRFTARMSSYRNVRYDFDGNYWRALWVFLLGPFVSVFTLFLLLPAVARAAQKYLADSFTYGGRPLTLNVGLGSFYWIYFQGLLIFIAVGLISYVLFAPVLAGIDWAAIAEGENPPPPGQIVLFAGLYIAFIVVFAVVPIYIQTLVTNLTFNKLVLDDKHHFESKMGPFRMVWIVLSNLVAIIFTLGLMIPWARVRVARYRASKTALLAGGSLDQYTSTVSQDSAIGEEVAQAFDLDIPI